MRRKSMAQAAIGKGRGIPAEARDWPGDASRWRHAGLAAGAQRQPDLAEAASKARRAREEAKEVGKVAERVFWYR